MHLDDWLISAVCGLDNMRELALDYRKQCSSNQEKRRKAVLHQHQMQHNASQHSTAYGSRRSTSHLYSRGQHEHSQPPTSTSSLPSSSSSMLSASDHLLYEGLSGSFIPLVQVAIHVKRDDQLIRYHQEPEHKHQDKHQRKYQHTREVENKLQRDGTLPPPSSTPSSSFVMGLLASSSPVARAKAYSALMQIQDREERKREKRRKDQKEQEAKEKVQSSSLSMRLFGTRARRMTGQQNSTRLRGGTAGAAEDDSSLSLDEQMQTLVDGTSARMSGGGDGAGENDNGIGNGGLLYCNGVPLPPPLHLPIGTRMNINTSVNDATITTYTNESTAHSDSSLKKREGSGHNATSGVADGVADGSDACAAAAAGTALQYQSLLSSSTLLSTSFSGLPLHINSYLVPKRGREGRSLSLDKGWMQQFVADGATRACVEQVGRQYYRSYASVCAERKKSRDAEEQKVEAKTEEEERKPQATKQETVEERTEGDSKPTLASSLPSASSLPTPAMTVPLVSHAMLDFAPVSAAALKQNIHDLFIGDDNNTNTHGTYSSHRAATASRDADEGGAPDADFSSPSEQKQRDHEKDAREDREREAMFMGAVHAWIPKLRARKKACDHELQRVYANDTSQRNRVGGHIDSSYSSNPRVSGDGYEYEYNGSGGRAPTHGQLHRQRHTQKQYHRYSSSEAVFIHNWNVCAISEGGVMAYMDLLMYLRRMYLYAPSPSTLASTATTERVSSSTSGSTLMTAEKVNGEDSVQKRLSCKTRGKREGEKKMHRAEEEEGGQGLLLYQHFPRVHHRSIDYNAILSVHASRAQSQVHAPMHSQADTSRPVFVRSSPVFLHLFVKPFYHLICTTKTPLFITRTKEYIQQMQQMQIRQSTSTAETTKGEHEERAESSGSGRDNTHTGTGTGTRTGTGTSTGTVTGTDTIASTRPTTRTDTKMRLEAETSRAAATRPVAKIRKYTFITASSSLFRTEQMPLPVERFLTDHYVRLSAVVGLCVVTIDPALS